MVVYYLLNTLYAVGNADKLPGIPKPVFLVEQFVAAVFAYGIGPQDEDCSVLFVDFKLFHSDISASINRLHS